PVPPERAGVRDAQGVEPRALARRHAPLQDQAVRTPGREEGLSCCALSPAGRGHAQSQPKFLLGEGRRTAPAHPPAAPPHPASLVVNACLPSPPRGEGTVTDASTYLYDGISCCGIGLPMVMAPDLPSASIFSRLRPALVRTSTACSPMPDTRIG